MGDNRNMLDFVTLKNAVHAHILAADKLDAPPLSPDTFEVRIQPVACTVRRRNLPTSEQPDPTNAKPDPPLPASRNRWNQFYSLADDPSSTLSLSVAGHAFFITNGEPVPFWTFARAVYFAYSRRPPRWYEPIVFPNSVGMLFATLSEWAGWCVGKRPEECAVNRAYMQYVLYDLYMDIERVRLANLLPLTTLF